jgi:hypothetical protein
VKTAHILLILCLLSPAAISQQQQQQQDEGPAAQIREKMQRDQMKALNKERQASLKKDMDDLYKLATELKDSVDKTDENVMSLQVIRKTEQIEKLARDIRKKMRDAY